MRKEDLKDIINKANDALLETDCDDPEHDVQCHADTVALKYLLVSGAVKKAISILQEAIHNSLDENERKLPFKYGRRVKISRKGSVLNGMTGYVAGLEGEFVMVMLDKQESHNPYPYWPEDLEII